MSLTAGTRLGPYEIGVLLGQGGMGEVYRARDTTLGRDVAVKVISESFTYDPERIARFEREARLLASLNHPHIATVHGLEQSGGTQFLVMELVEGETLADRLKGGALPIGDALAIAGQIADALQAAHDKGIIHRDLKPANIALTGSDQVKVLDFGLAKAIDAAPAGDAANSPTLTRAATQAGMILGTAAYMSPEQAKGKEADRKADVWAFGCVLYEMLAGRAVFEGETAGEILAGVLKEEPDWHRLPAETPEGIRRLLRRCLQKDINLRHRDIGDARLEIDEARTGAQTDGHPVYSASRRRERVIVLSTLALVTLIAAVAMVRAFRPPPPAPEVRLEINTPPTTLPASLAISPDGRTIVFVADSENRLRLWLRLLDSGAARPLTGTDGAMNPFWSPDSRAIGFFADGKLKRIDIDGGSVQTLANASNGTGGAWSRDGVILFTMLGTPIFRVSDAGGDPVAVTPVGNRQGSLYAPQFLPDSRHFLYWLRGTPEVGGVYVGELGSTLSRRLLDADHGAIYASSGHLLFLRQTTLFAQDFDPVRLELAGNPFPVAERVASSADGAAVSVSGAGSVAYRTGATGVERQFAWFDRSGREISRVGAASPSLSHPSLSHDGQRVVLYRNVSRNTDIWLLEPMRGVLSRFTSDVADDVYPIWSPDDDRIVFSSNRKGIMDLYQKSATTGGTEELLLSTVQAKLATDWSPDGRFVLFRSLDPKRGFDIWALPLDENGKPGTPFPVMETNFEEQGGQFSPDGNWIAYQSDESGRAEIYAQPFPGPGNKWPISTNGGSQVRWARDGKELFYVALDGRLMAVPIRIESNAGAPEVGTPVPLFAPRLGGAVQQADYRHQYMVSSDGQRFLVATVTEEANSPITVILNWKPKP